MGLNFQFSIGVHLMAALAERANERVPSRELASSVNTSPSFVRRVLAKLSKAGLVRTTTGKSGSCSLARAARSITLLEIYRAVEHPIPFAIHDYPVQRDCLVSCGIKSSLRKVQDQAQQALEDCLRQTTLAQVVGEIVEAGA